MKNIFPFLPPDFDDRYFQMAPPDQQIDYPRGGEEVQLVNLTPEGRLGFQLPPTGLSMTLFKHIPGTSPLPVDADIHIRVSKM